MRKIYLIAALTTAGCVTPQTPIAKVEPVTKSSKSIPSTSPTLKKASPANPNQAVVKNSAQQSPPNLGQFGFQLYVDLVEFADSVSSTKTAQLFEFSVTQEEVLASLAGTQNQTNIQRATLALSILARASSGISHLKSISNGSNKNNISSEEKSQVEPRVLESLSSDYELNLGNEFVTNPFLGSLEIHKFAVFVILESDASQEFKVFHLREMLKSKQSWNENHLQIEAWLKNGNTNFSAPKEEDLASDAAVSPTSSTAPAFIPVPTPPSTSPSDGASPVKAISTEPPSLVRAKELATSGNYLDSVTMLAQIPASSPDYPEAQTQLKSYSNTAVQDLRRKAAASYQNSLLVSDIETRKAYLTEAKKYLETALFSFPKTELKSTLQDNLQKISRQLDEIGKGNQ
jgi:hypothetical protein